MTASQMELDFSAPAKTLKLPRRSARERKPGDRPHHRTTTLTVPQYQFDRVCNATDDEPVDVRYVNDIISSAAGGNSTVHHFIRRTDLLADQWRGGFRKVNVRYTPDVVLACEMCSAPDGETDDCSGSILVRKISQTEK